MFSICLNFFVINNWNARLTSIKSCGIQTYFGRFLQLDQRFHMIWIIKLQSTCATYNRSHWCDVLVVSAVNEEDSLVHETQHNDLMLFWYWASGWPSSKPTLDLRCVSTGVCHRGTRISALCQVVHWHLYAVLMSGQWRRRWPNFKSTRNQSVCAMMVTTSFCSLNLCLLHRTHMRDFKVLVHI